MFFALFFSRYNDPDPNLRNGHKNVQNAPNSNIFLALLPKVNGLLYGKKVVSKPAKKLTRDDKANSLKAIRSKHAILTAPNPIAD